MYKLFYLVRNYRYECILAVSIVLAAYLGLTYYLGAGRDDTFITLWAGETFAQGDFFVNHNFDRVEISSSLVHTLIVAGLALIGPDHLYFLNKLAGLLAGLLLLGLIYRHRETLLPWPKQRFIAFCMIQATLSTTPAVLYWNLGGLETPFVTLLLFLNGIGFVRFWHRPTPGNANRLIIVQILFIASRPEAFFIVLFSVVFGILFTVYKEWRSRLVWLICVPAAFFLALSLGRYALFGTFMPNPVYAKTSFGTWNVGAGLTYLSEFYRSSYMMLVLGGITLLVLIYYMCLLIRSCRRPELLAQRAEGSLIFILGLVVTLHLITLLSGGDWMEYFRFMHAAIPLICIVSLGFAVIAVESAVRYMKKAKCPAVIRWAFALGMPALFTALWVENLHQSDLVTSWQGDQEIGIRSSTRKCSIGDLLSAKPWHDSAKPLNLDERIKMLNSCYARDREQLFAFLEKPLQELHQINGELVIATPQMGFFPYYLKKRYPDLNISFIDTRGLCDQNVALLDLEGGPYGLEYGAPLARIMSGGAGSLSEFVLSKKPNMLYRVFEKPQDIQILNNLGYKVVLFKPQALVLFNADIR